MTDLVQLGFKADTAGLTKAQRELDKTTKSGAKFDTQSKKTEKAMGGVGRSAGAAGIQIQQFVGQIQGGQNAMVALSQQSADLGIVLGAPLLGVFVSLAAVAGGVLAPALFNSKDAMQQLEDVSDSLKISLMETGEGADVLSQHIEKLAKRSEALARLQISSSIIDAEKQIKIASQGVTEAIDGIFSGITKDADVLNVIRTIGGDVSELYTKLSDFSKLPKNVFVNPDTLVRLRTEVERVSNSFDISESQASRFILALKTMEEEASPTNIKLLENTLSDLNDETGGTSGKLAKLGAELIPLFEATTDGVDKVNLLRLAFAQLGETLKEDSETGSQFTTALGKVTSSLKMQLIALEDGADAAKKYGIAQALGLESIKELPKPLTDLIDKISDLEQEQSSAQAFQAINDQLDMQRKKLELTANEFEIYQIRMKAIASGVAPEMIQSLIKIAVANQELKQSMEDSGEAITKTTTEWAEITELAADRIDQAFADVWVSIWDGFDSVADSLVNSFKRMLAEMAHAAITKPILVQITGSMGASGSGILGSLGGIGGMLGAGAASTTALLGQGSVSGALANTGALFGGGQLMAGLGSLVPMIAGVAAIAGLVDSISGGKLFGTSYSASGSSLNLGLSGGNVLGTTSLEESKKRSLFRGTKTRTTTSDFDTSSISEIFDTVQMSIIDAANAFDIDSVTKTSTQAISDGYRGYFDLITKTTEMSIEGYLKTFSRSLVLDTSEMSEEEIQKSIQKWVSSTTDSMIDSVFGSMISGLKKESETSAEALDRLILNMNAMSIVSDTLNIGFNLTGIDAAKAATNIIDLVGGLDALNATTTQYYNNFIPQQEKLNSLTQDLGSAFNSLGQPMISTREGFKSLVDGLDLTTQSDQALFASLMQLVPAMDEYLTQLEDLASNKLSLQIELLKAQGNAELALSMSRQQELDLINESLRPLQKQIWAQQDLNAEREKELSLLESQKALLESNVKFAESQLDNARDAEIDRINAVLQGAKDTYSATIDSINLQRSAYNTLIGELEASLTSSVSLVEKARQLEIDKINATIDRAQQAYDLELELINYQRAAFNDLTSELESNFEATISLVEKARGLELDKITASVDKAQQAYDLEIESINAQRTAYNQLISEIEGRVNNAASALDKSLSFELAKYDDLISAAQDSASTQINSINDIADTRLKALNDERSIVERISNQFGALSKSVTASEALEAARGGNFEPAGRIQSGSFDDATSARIGAAREAFALNEIGKLADAQLSDLDKTIAATEAGVQAQINAINRASNMQIAELEAQKLAIENQVKALLGIDDSVMSLDVAMAQYQSAQDELNQEIANDTLTVLQSQEDAALALLDRFKLDSQLQIDAINAQVDAVLGIDSTITSLTDSINQYQAAQLALETQTSADTLEKLDSQEAAALALLEQSKLDGQLQINAINLQVDTLLGLNESVLSLSLATITYQDAQQKLNEATSAKTLELLQSQEDAAIKLLQVAETDNKNQIDALNTQIDNLLNIDNSVLSVKNAIDMLASERQALAALDYENQRAQINAQYATIAAIESARAASQIETPVDKTNNITDNQRVIQELQLLRKEQEIANAQIASNTANTALEARTTNNLLS